MTKVQALSLAIEVIAEAQAMTGYDEDFEDAINILNKMENQIINQSRKARQKRISKKLFKQKELNYRFA